MSRTLVNCSVWVHAVNGADGHHIRHRLRLRQECRLQLSNVLVQAQSLVEASSSGDLFLPAPFFGGAQKRTRQPDTAAV